MADAVTGSDAVARRVAQVDVGLAIAIGKIADVLALASLDAVDSSRLREAVREIKKAKAENLLHAVAEAVPATPREPAALPCQPADKFSPVIGKRAS